MRGRDGALGLAGLAGFCALPLERLHGQATGRGRSIAAAWSTATAPECASTRSRPSFLRPVYKAAEFCQAEPDIATRRLVDGKFVSRDDYALHHPGAALRALARVRLEDSMRFHALRLHEVGMIKRRPNVLIAQGTDWRSLNELQRELKA